MKKIHARIADRNCKAEKPGKPCYRESLIGVEIFLPLLFAASAFAPYYVTKLFGLI